MKQQSIRIEDLLVDPSFIAYVQKSDPGAVAHWESVIAGRPGDRTAIELARKMVQDMTVEVDDDAVDDAVIRLKHAVRVKQNSTISITRQYDPQRRFRWYRYAAIFVAFVTAAFILGFFISRHLHRDAVQAGLHKDQWVVKQTTRGQKTMIVLKDGTRIRLNAESTLWIPDVFSDSIREVRLKGEAYFDVTHDPAHPFIVRSNNTSTRVLGTSFNINAYPENKQTTIALVEGKVEVAIGEADPVYVQPEQMIKVSRKGTQYERELFNPAEVTAWKDGVIRFDRASFEEIVKVLERWYDVDFTVNATPSVHAFSGEFNNESLEEVLKGISFSLDFKYRLDGKKVYIN